MTVWVTDQENGQFYSNKAIGHSPAQYAMFCLVDPLDHHLNARAQANNIRTLDLLHTIDSACM